MSAVYVPHATLLDSCDNGFRKGTGVGLEAAFSWEKTDVKHLVGRAGIGYRSLRFGEFEVDGYGSTPTDLSLNATHFFVRGEVRF